MIQVMPQSHANILGVRASRSLTDDDYRSVWLPSLEELLRTYQKVRLLLYMDDSFQGWEPKAALDHAGFGLIHVGNVGDFERLAIVGGPAWTAGAAKLTGYMMKGEVRTFSCKSLREAWFWIMGRSWHV